MINIFHKNSMKVFEEFIKYECPIIIKINDDVYTFCAYTICKHCNIQSLCDKLVGNKQPVINKNQIKIIKEKYPEYFILIIYILYWIVYYKKG